MQKKDTENTPLLVIIYNHKFEQNIEKLERHYAGRFSTIFHLVPFYSGKAANVIPVYENSRYFQGYVAQAFRNLPQKNISHFIFIGDDLLLNPVINEENYSEWMKLDANTAFIPGLIQLHEVAADNFWMRVFDAYHYTLYPAGVEVANELPDREELIQKFEKFGLGSGALTFDQVYPKQQFRQKRKLREWIQYFDYRYLRLKSRLTKRQFRLGYPLVGAYSDLFVIPSVIASQFAHYCGVFAATDLFVELAIPTALVMTAKKINQETDLALQGKALWTQQDMKLLEPYHNDFSSLVNNFPTNYLYLHPIKLSKWKNS